MSTWKLDHALDLMRRLPPSQVEENLANLLDLAPDLQEDLLSNVDQPLKIAFDPIAKKDYLLCDYNRDEDSFRSPWSNKYDPPFTDGYEGLVPSDELRKLEVDLNFAFDVYRDQYFEGGVSSVYCWETDDGFALVVLIKKTQDQTKKGHPMRGTWDSIHVVDVRLESKTKAAYTLTSTVTLTIETTADSTGTLNLGGSLARQQKEVKRLTTEDTHVVHVGRLIEDHENKMRIHLEALYFSKTKEISGTLRDILLQLRSGVSGVSE